MSRDSLRCIFYIILKDMRTYYLKPPSISWGIIFPLAWTLAFYLRHPQTFAQLVPGMVAMTAIFSTTAAEAVVINFELRVGSMERLLLAPISPGGIFLAKLLGGFAFGFLMTLVVAIGSSLALGIHLNVPIFLLVLIFSLLSFASLGAFICVSVKEIFEAQTLLNLPRFIMIFLSGVITPISALPHYLQYISYLMPLTYTVDGFRHAISQATYQGINIWLDILVLLVFSLAFILPGRRMLERKFE
ncbi:ABC transporter permease [bacterium]|nr:ABC transporter permease [bacterium]